MDASTDAEALSLTDREHNAGLHNPNIAGPIRLCRQCFPDGPPPTPAPVRPAAQPEPVANTQRPPAGSLASALMKVRSRIVVDQPDAADPGPRDHGPACDVCKGNRFVRRDELRPGDPGFGLAVPCDACIGWTIQQRARKLLGDLPSEFRDWTLDSYPASTGTQQRMLAELRTWLETEDWMALIGKRSRGKTGLAIGLLKALMAEPYRKSGAFQVVPDMLDALRNAYASRSAWQDAQSPILAALRDVQVLVLDDMGAERVNDWVAEEFYKLLAHRHRTLDRRTIVTSNFDLLELAAHLGDMGERVPARIEERAGRGRWVLDLSRLPNLRQDAAL